MCELATGAIGTDHRSNNLCYEHFENKHGIVHFVFKSLRFFKTMKYPQF